MKNSPVVGNRQSAIANGGPDVICLGELLIDFVPHPSLSPLGEAKWLRMAPGGAPANVAVALSRLGIKSGFVGKVGNDPFGRYLRQILIEQGIDLTLLGLSQKAFTRLAFVTNDANEQQRFLFYGNPGADVLLAASDVRDSYFRQARAFHFGSISLIQEPSRSATLQAIASARKHGLTVSFDPNLRTALWPSLAQARREILEAMEFCHVLKVNESEWEFLFPGKNFADSLPLLKRKGISLAAMTQGARGSMIGTDRAVVRIQGRRVRVVDTTGAGDGFMAGLIYCVLNRKTQGIVFDRSELREVARFAGTVGTITCTKAGAILSFPSLRQVKRYL